MGGKNAIRPGRDTITPTGAPSIKLEKGPFFDPSMGTSAVGSPVSPSAVNVSGLCAKSIGEDWVDRVHVLPRRIDFGNILGTVNTAIEVFSAFRAQDISFTAFVNNVGAGMQITDLPSLPATITPFAGITMNLETTTEGVPQFNTTLDFVFDVGTFNMPVTGQRVIMFPYRPDMPMRETLGFLTEIFEHTDGSEQRVALRKNPRQKFNMTLSRLEGTERSRIDMLMFDWQARVFGLPMWHEPSELTVATAVNDTTITVDSTANADLRVGGLAIVLQPDEVTFDALQISSFTATTITFNAGVQNIHPVGTQVFPIRTVLANQIFTGERFAQNLSKFQIEFSVIDNDSNLADTSAFNTFGGKVFLDDANFIDTVLRESYQKRLTIFDNDTGVLNQDSPWTVNRRGSSKTFITQSRAALWNVRRLMHALRGRQVSFWIPTFYKEVIPTATLASGAATMTIENVGYNRFVQNRSPKDEFRIVLKNGTLLERTVSSSNEISSTSEQITFDDTWPSTITVDEIERVEILEKVRIDTDNIVISHENTIGQAKISFPVRVVLE